MGGCIATIGWCSKVSSTQKCPLFSVSLEAKHATLSPNYYVNMHTIKVENTGSYIN